MAKTNKTNYVVQQPKVSCWTIAAWTLGACSIITTVGNVIVTVINVKSEKDAAARRTTRRKTGGSRTTKRTAKRK